MNNKTKLLIAFFPFLILSFLSCSNDDDEEQSLPNLSTLELSNIMINSVQSGGLNIDNKGSEILDKGICWSLNSEPTINDFILSSGGNSQDFNIEITELEENTTYYLRAYAVNNKGTGYGNELSFTTKMDIDVPCSPQLNSIVIDSSIKNLFGSFYATSGLFYGDYGLRSSSSGAGDLNIEFSSPPEIGVYLISSDPFHMNSTECAVTIVYSNHRYTAKDGIDAFVYVEKTDTDKYSMSFCNLDFRSGSTTYTFNESNGNLIETF